MATNNLSEEFSKDLQKMDQKEEDGQKSVEIYDKLKLLKTEEFKPPSREIKIADYLKSKQGKSLQQQLLGNPKDQRKNERPLNILLGNGVKYNDIPSSVNHLMKRDHPNIANLTIEQFRQKLR